MTPLNCYRGKERAAKAAFFLSAPGRAQVLKGNCPQAARRMKSCPVNQDTLTLLGRNGPHPTPNI